MDGTKECEILREKNFILRSSRTRAKQDLPFSSFSLLKHTVLLEPYTCFSIFACRILMFVCVFFLPISYHWFCVQLYIQFSKFFRRLSYQFFGLSCEAFAKQETPRYAMPTPLHRVELRRPTRERWSEEYTGWVFCVKRECKRGARQRGAQEFSELCLGLIFPLGL